MRGMAFGWQRVSNSNITNTYHITPPWFSTGEPSTKGENSKWPTVNCSVTFCDHYESGARNDNVGIENLYNHNRLDAKRAAPTKFRKITGKKSSAGQNTRDHHCPYNS